MPTEYYMICNSNRHIIAIHRVRDSARAYFDRMCLREDCFPVVYISVMRVDDHGKVLSETLIRSYDKVVDTYGDYNLDITNID